MSPSLNTYASLRNRLISEASGTSDSNETVENNQSELNTMSLTVSISYYQFQETLSTVTSNYLRVIFNYSPNFFCIDY